MFTAKKESYWRNSDSVITLRNEGIHKELLVSGRNAEADAEVIADAINKAVEIDPYRRYVVIPFTRKSWNTESQHLCLIDLFELTIEWKKVSEEQTCGLI